MKAVVSRKFIALGASKKNLARAYPSSLTTCQKDEEQSKENVSKRSRQHIIIKLRDEVIQIETKRSTQRINKTVSWNIEKNQ